MPTAVDLSLPLSEILHKGTLAAHEEVEHSAGAHALISGELKREEYVQFLMMLWHIYDAFEEALERHASHPVLQPTHNPTLLARRDALGADISYLLEVPETSWQSHPLHLALRTSPPAGLDAYTSRIRTLSESNPARLLAHSYVRYLGDLSGGQFIRHRLAKAYSLDEQTGSGLAFYHFSQLGAAGASASIGDMRKIKGWFKAGMDAGVNDNDALKEEILEEANIAFQLNNGLFKAIEAFTAAHASTVPASKELPGVIEHPQEEKTYPLATVVSVIAAICLAHFLLVVGGFTGDKGYAKLLAFEQWVGSLWVHASE
ncbi:hypothetical protein HGRIS_005771 [Hohenbuehelia grisea]|uniref:Heme oxygenase n=1 Tax=Hohenbuehelia grisea TaxID=104357 RepID=A0ABR3JY34_9AGAR